MGKASRNIRAAARRTTDADEAGRVTEAVEGGTSWRQ